MRVLLPSLALEQFLKMVVVARVYVLDVFEQHAQVLAATVGASDFITFDELPCVFACIRIAN